MLLSYRGVRHGSCPCLGVGVMEIFWSKFCYSFMWQLRKLKLTEVTCHGHRQSKYLYLGFPDSGTTGNAKAISLEKLGDGSVVACPWFVSRGKNAVDVVSTLLGSFQYLCVQDIRQDVLGLSLESPLKSPNSLIYFFKKKSGTAIFQ